MYCPIHGKKLVKEKKLSDPEAMINQKCGIYESIAICNDEDQPHKVYITDRQCIEQLGEIEVVLS